MNDEMNKFSQGLIAKYEPIEIPQEILDKLNEIGLPGVISKEELKRIFDEKFDFIKIL